MTVKQEMALFIAVVVLTAFIIITIKDVML